MNVTTLRSSRRHQAIAVAVAIALIAVLWLIFAGGKKEMPPPPPVPVGVMRAEQRDVPHMASGIGTVESLHNVTLRPQVEGVLAEVLFQEGQMVRHASTTGLSPPRWHRRRPRRRATRPSCAPPSRI